jgi:hypothetical protein
MKLLKTYVAKGLMLVMGLFSLIIFLSIIAQIISLSFYTFLLIAAVMGIAYFYYRSST